MAIGYSVANAPEYAAGFHRHGPNFAVPALMLVAFPSWSAGTFALATCCWVRLRHGGRHCRGRLHPL
jgi:hypothetical protein